MQDSTVTLRERDSMVLRSQLEICCLDGDNPLHLQFCQTAGNCLRQIRLPAAEVGALLDDLCLRRTEKASKESYHKS